MRAVGYAKRGFCPDGGIDTGAGRDDLHPRGCGHRAKVLEAFKGATRKQTYYDANQRGCHHVCEADTHPILHHLRDAHIRLCLREGLQIMPM